MFTFVSKTKKYQKKYGLGAFICILWDVEMSPKYIFSLSPSRGPKLFQKKCSYKILSSKFCSNFWELFLKLFVFKKQRRMSKQIFAGIFVKKSKACNICPIFCGNVFKAWFQQCPCQINLKLANPPSPLYQKSY